MMKAFTVLTRFKGLRGTPFDLFGKTEERQQERLLVQHYFELLDEFADSLSEQNLAAAIQLAELPDTIRGFGHVKEKNMQAAQLRRAELLDVYRSGKQLDRVA